jgi:uncharacterized protein YnzC (UPF0291/DUF896 family)
MTPRERLVTEIWKAASHRPLARLVALADKAQDAGLTADERREYAEVKAENSRLFREYLGEIRGVKRANR